MKNSFEKFYIGYSDSFKRKISHGDVENFAKLSGDNNQLHMDQEYASSTQFEQRVVHGFLHASFLSKLIGEKIPGPGALYLSQSIKFTAPVFINDELIVTGKVIKTNQNLHTLELETTISKTSGEIVLSGVAKVRLLENCKKKTVPAPKEVNLLSSLSEKNALVTGGSRGIGAAIVRQLAANGAFVFIGYNKSKNAAKEVLNSLSLDGLKGELVKLDINSQKEINKVYNFIEKKGGLDILVNNAGPKIQSRNFDNWEWSDMSEQYDNILGGTFKTTKTMLPLLKRGKGKIINIVSTAALGRTAHGWLPYVSAKAALIAFSKNLAQELGPKGIKVNMVSPSMVNTNLVMDVPQRYKDMAIANTPLRDMATEKDVANAVLFLASPLSDFISGENIIVSGGAVMQ